MKTLTPPIYIKERPLPPYSFLPGQNIHPEKEGGHYFGHSLEVSINQSTPITENPDFLHGLDLFNHGYHWESHVWWEALWNAYQRTTPTALYLQALIKWSAAEVKARMKHYQAAKGHLERSQELLEGLKEKTKPEQLDPHSLLSKILHRLDTIDAEVGYSAPVIVLKKIWMTTL